MMTNIRYQNAFTIVELLVAMSLLVIMLGLSGMVFNTTVDAHRAAGASIDVTRNLRAITDQLNADFQGLRKDAPVFFAFEQQWVDTNGDGIQDLDELTHYDMIHFFADGDYQTTKQYYYDNDLNGTVDDDDGDGVISEYDRYKTIYGNIARIFYGHANTPGNVDFANNDTLARKSQILTVDNRLYNVYGEIPLITDTSVVPPVQDYTPFDTSFGLMTHSLHTYINENELEFNTITLTNWIAALNLVEAAGPLNANHFIIYCMTDAYRPQVDLDDIDTLHLLLSQGVLEMQIQWAYTADDLVTAGLFPGVRWWPSADPDGDGDTTDSDFITMTRDQLGVYFTLPVGINVDIDGNSTNDWFFIQNCGTSGVGFKNTFYPKTLKFTFVLRDSNGIFADGKTFTHIVTID